MFFNKKRLIIFLFHNKLKKNKIEDKMKTLEDRIIDLEIIVTDQEKMLAELNEECVKMSKTMDTLIKQNKILMEFLKESPVKPLSEETKPPHY